MEEKTIQSETIYKGSILTLRKDIVQLHNGKKASREIIEHAPVAVIIPFEPPDTIYMIKQYRKPAEQILLEVPAGCMDAGENALDSAKRELKEETGFTANKWTELCEAYPSPGFTDEYMYFYLAQGLTKGETDFDEDENIEMEAVKFETALSLIKQKKILDGKTIIALLMAKEYL